MNGFLIAIIEIPPLFTTFASSLFILGFGKNHALSYWNRSGL
jgi:ribose/xylose/arabinose/galactoside ABC-type transport system permease subunit